jgi:hypothetical protein
VDEKVVARRQAWTRQEIEAGVTAYFEMLRAEHRGERYAKTTVVSRLASLLLARSPAAIERKFQNISAVLDELGQPWIDGYKPLAHYQRDLRDALEDRLKMEHRLAEALVGYAATALPAPQPERAATDDVLVPPPLSARPTSARSSVRLTGGALSALRDYQTKALGDAGESWVVDLERAQLARAGRTDLAERVQWTAKDVGDGVGYDIASFWSDGRARLIEVKTTNYGDRTPFYITRWEVRCSARNPDAYSLYRVHGFARDPRVYILNGSMEEAARLEPSVFLGLPR